MTNASFLDYVSKMPEARRKALLSQAGRQEEKLRCEASLMYFLKCAWPSFDPSNFVSGWHLEAIAEHLQAVSRGEIRKLLVNIPPRHCKTGIVNVAWQAWIWAQKRDDDFPLMGPHVRFLCLSYGDQLAADIATTARRLITSSWYTGLWGDRVKLDPDTMGKGKFDNLRGGSRISTSFAGATLGRGGDIRIYDDANKTTEIESDTEREKVIRTYEEALKSRVTDPKTSAEVCVAQRLHSEDLSGHLLDTDSDWVHLCLPAEFDGRRCMTYVRDTLFWQDEREEGELLWPEQWDEKELQTHRSNPYAWAGQYQQLPVPRGGGILKEAWWGDWTDNKRWPTFEYVLASLDGAYTKDTKNDPSALVIFGIYEDQNENRRIMLVEGWRKWLEINDLVVEVAKSCREFKVDRLLIENKASGKSVAQELIRLFAGEMFGVDLVNPTSKDKEARVHAVVSIFTDGLRYDADSKSWEGNRLINTNLSKDWAQMVVAECIQFPNAKHDDLLDAVTQALQYLRDTGLAELGWEIRERQTRALQYRRASSFKPLYQA